MRGTAYSNKLYHNEVRDFADAMSLVSQECDHENSQFAMMPYSEPLRQQGIDACRIMKRAARECLNEYNAAGGLTKALIDKWKASEVEIVQCIGECAEAGDYSRLAI